MPIFGPGVVMRLRDMIRRGSASTRGDVIPATGTTFFTQDVATTSSYLQPAAYDATANKTWHFWEGYNPLTSKRMLRVSVFDHSSGTWVGPYTASRDIMVDDDHGVPSTDIPDANGYMHVFGGSHNEPAEWATTAAPRDPRFWVQRSSPYTGGYPHTIIRNGKAKVFFRGTALSEGKMAETTLAADGSASAWTNRAFATFSSGRWYLGDALVVGDEIHLASCQADANDNNRQDVYYLVYNLVTESIRNASGSVVVPKASQPITQDTLDASFKLRDQKSTNRATQTPALARTPDGTIHVLYFDGDFARTTASVLAFTISQGVVGSDVLLDTISTYRTDLCMATNPVTGEVRGLWGDGAAATTGNGASSNTIRTAVRSADGTWSAASTFFTKERAYPLRAVRSVINGVASHLFTFGETTQDVSDEEPLRAYAAAFDGTLKRRTTGQNFNPQWPDLPAFPALGPNQPMSTLIVSAVVTITGLAETAPIVLGDSAGGTGFQYRINGGAWSTAEGRISNGDTLQLGATTAATATSGSMSVMIGGWGAAISYWTWSTVTVTTAEQIIAAVEARDGTTVASTQRQALKTMIQGMIDDGDWATFDHVVVRALPTQTLALRDFISARDESIVGSPTFTANRGFSGTGSSAYIQGTFNPSTHGQNFAKDSAGILYTARSSTGSNGAVISFETGLTGTAAAASLGINASGGPAGRINFGIGTGRVAGSNNAGAGIATISVTRTSSTAITFYRDGSAAGTGSVASTAVPNVAKRSMENSRETIIEIIGGGWSGTAVSRIANRISTWKTAIGA